MLTNFFNSNKKRDDDARDDDNDDAGETDCSNYTSDSPFYKID